MNEEEIKAQLRTPAIKLIAGGFRPSNELTESWLGKVFLFHPSEGIPLDQNGREMIPLAQFYLPTLSIDMLAIGETKLITLFMSEDYPEPLEPMGRNWMIREYDSIEGLQRRDDIHSESYLKPFPLATERIEEDYPVWDGGGVPADLEDQIIELEELGKIGDYFDFAIHCDAHKFGGYPSFCQPGIDVGDGFEFIFQIASDSKINLNVVDDGRLMFWKID